MDEITKVWPEWRTVELLGQGTFGNVYKVEKVDFGKSYYAAVKVINYPYDDMEVKDLQSAGMDPHSIRKYFEEDLRNLIEEIQTMESLKTAGNIVSIEDYKLVEKTGEFGWRLYIRMELLKSLNTYLEEKGSLSDDETVKIGIDICSALECCERKNTIHRDIKPANIFLNEYGDFKLGDFGLAKQRENSISVKSQKGTLPYMAPEIYRGESYDNTVDIYALGITLYRFLNHNRFPYMPPAPQDIRPGDADKATTARISGQPMPDPTNCDAELAGIVKKACAFRPEDRYLHAVDMKKDLETWKIKKMYQSMQEETLRRNETKVEVKKPEQKWTEPESEATVGPTALRNQSFTEPVENPFMSPEDEATYAAFNHKMNEEKSFTSKNENINKEQEETPKQAPTKRIKRTRHITLTQQEEIEGRMLLNGTKFDMVVDCTNYWIPVKAGTKDGDIVTVPLLGEDGYLDVTIRLDILKQEPKKAEPTKFTEQSYNTASAAKTQQTKTTGAKPSGTTAVRKQELGRGRITIYYGVYTVLFILLYGNVIEKYTLYITKGLYPNIPMGLIDMTVLIVGMLLSIIYEKKQNAFIRMLLLIDAVLFVGCGFYELLDVESIGELIFFSIGMLMMMSPFLAIIKRLIGEFKKK